MENADAHPTFAEQPTPDERPASEQRPNPAPIDAPERTALLDVIRGFALSGVFLSNVHMWMSGAILKPGEGAHGDNATTFQKVIDAIFGIFINGRFMTMFTFLFGLGLAMQFSRAADRGDSASKRYVRRCLALVLLGVLHLALLWYGDITHQYALIGLLVLLFRNRSTKTLVIWGLVLTLVAVPVGMWSTFLLPKLLHGPEVAQAAMAARMAQDEAFHSQALAVFQGTSYLAIVKMNLAMYWHHFVNPIVGAYSVSTLGNFLLGVAVGRLGWFHDVPAHKKAFKRLLGWGVVASVLSLGIVIAARLILGSEKAMMNSLVVNAIMPVSRNVITLSMALVYMSAIALLYQRNFFRRLLSIYAPVGRMAVTNYFAQSAIGLFVFCGIGLGHIGDLRPRWTIVMPVVMFSVQMVFSWIWLRNFRFGPVEWISRSLTYGKLQSMRYPKPSTSEALS
jgi:uncharacterized protein